MNLNEPQFKDMIQLLDHTGRPGNRVSYVQRVVSEDRDEELFEVIDSYQRSRIVTQGATDRQWIEVEL